MYRKLGRDSSARKALFRSVLTSFFRHGRIETTEAKAKPITTNPETVSHAVVEQFFWIILPYCSPPTWW